MNTKFKNSATCEVCLVIRFVNGKNVHLAQIQREIVDVYGEGAVNKGNVRRCFRLFKEGRTNVHGEE
jgi:hypothetical protein